MKKLFESIDNWSVDDVESEHPSRKQVKNEINNISFMYNNMLPLLKKNKLRLV